MSERPKSKPDQQRRLSAALRDNLKRRKAQVKGRSQAEAGKVKPHDSAGIDPEKAPEIAAAKPKG